MLHVIPIHFFIPLLGAEHLEELNFCHCSVSEWREKSVAVS